MDLQNCTNIVVVGGVASGKTSVITKYLYNIFNENYVTTRDIKLYTHGKYLRMWEYVYVQHHCIWNWGRYAHGAIIVYDMHNIDSYNQIEDWINEARRFTNEPIIICGTKSDIPGGKIYKHDTITTFIVSAKTGENISDAVDYLLRQIKERNIAKYKEQAQKLKDYQEQQEENISQPGKKSTKGCALM